MEKYKENIVDFIEGRTDPETFYIWFESNSQILDWLQSKLPNDKTIEDEVEVNIGYFLKNLPQSKQDEINAAYQSLCEIVDIERAKKLVDLLCALDAKAIRFTNDINAELFTNDMDLLLYNFKKVLDNPSEYKDAYVQYMCESVKEFFEKKHMVDQEIPYDIRLDYSRNKTDGKLWTYVNIQSWLYDLMTEIYPDEQFDEDESLHEKASFMMDVCPEYIEGHEIDEAGIVEAIIEQVPESLPKAKRKKQIKELIKKEFHIVGAKYPRWVQGGEWPVSKSGKPMRFVEQKRKKGKGYENMLFTVYIFEDVETLEQRIIEQFT